MQPVRLGISSCLLGEKVRYDGSHQLDRFLTDTLGRYVEYVPVCPEVECGMGIPREALRLVGDPENPRLVTRRTGIDHTGKMLEWARSRVSELENENLSGFIFKASSPSSGMERVKVYGGAGMAVKKGVGMFARVFMEHFPQLPVEDDGRLHDIPLRENFIERIFALSRWRECLRTNRNIGGLVDFHTRHKLLVLSHSPKHYREMGKLVAQGAVVPEIFDKYEELFMAALRLKATTRKHTNVLLHMTGYFKKLLVADEKKELLEIISRFHEGYVPLIVPLTLINHYVRLYDQPYLRAQVYLNPHPSELMLRNHV